ncbi:MAG: protein kinase [Labilithrix sp.]|nr:protein kinase [Labilithrix sp.]MBX3225314.1 protein kinase [Labilithrix sp.]
MALEPAKLSDFKLAGALGSGATAKVYEATHVATGRPVAIKVMSDTGQSRDGQSHEMRERFAREALLLADVESRHVSQILGFGFDKGQPFLVLERLQGETLDAKLRRDGPVPVPIAVRWIEQLIVGVRDCHDAKVIHRDIKPSNIYLHRDGFDETVKLIDFGVARLREITGDIGGLTSASHVIGSMGYMAPEQFKNAKSVGFPADLYAVGVVIFRTLTGRLPFVSRSLEAVIRMKSEQALPPISSMPGMAKNPLLDWFVAKSMAREPSERFQSGREMLEHWWSVMANLDEDSTTDIMRGIGRVDESYAGRRPDARSPIPLPSQARGTSPPPTRKTSPPPTEPFSGPIEHEEHTMRRPARSAIASSRPLSSDRTMRDYRLPAPSSLEDVGPVTLPSHGGSAHADETVVPGVSAGAQPADDRGGDDLFDLPTRTDPGLRKLVERELELQKARRRDRG